MSMLHFQEIYFWGLKQEQKGTYLCSPAGLAFSEGGKAAWGR